MILLTGFPGFIAERLLPLLLRQPGVEAGCLVQEKFLPTAETAVKALEERSPGTQGRVRLMVGDITLEGLGLKADDASAARAGVRECYHLAAVYDLAISRETGHRINVVGTRNVLDFLRQVPGFHRLHYVSTAYVSGWATGVFRETDLDVGQSFKNHYEETKFEAEVEVVRSGVEATVYRPGIVVGDSRSGETAKFDGPYFALAAMERVPSPGLFMRVGSGRRPINLVPVDFVIESLAALSLDDQGAGKTYHLTDPEPLSVLEVERLLAREFGKSFAYLPVPTRLAKALFAPRFVQDFFGMPRQTLDYFDHDCRYDTTEARAALARAGLGCPRFPEYAKALVAFYQARRGAVRRGAMH